MLSTGMSSTKGYALLQQLGHYGIPKDTTLYNFVGQTSYPYQILSILLWPPQPVNSTGAIKSHKQVPSTFLSIHHSQSSTPKSSIHMKKRR